MGHTHHGHSHHTHSHHGHSHGSHGHSPDSPSHDAAQRSRSRQRLLFAFVLNISFALIEIAGGILTNSVAVLSNAFHDLGDAFSLGMSWYLEKISDQKKDERYSYGYARFSVLGALLNSVVLLIGSLAILTQAIPRLIHPEPVSLGGMLGFALVGLTINIVAAWRLHGGESLNERVVMWHLIEDVLGWAAVLVVIVGMKLFDAPILDPILSVLVTLFVLYNVIGRSREALKVFLQAVPESMQLREIQREIQLIPLVRGSHHTRLWSLDGQSHILTCHVVLAPEATSASVIEVKAAIKERLKKFAILDATIEIEQESEDCSSHD